MLKSLISTTYGSVFDAFKEAFRSHDWLVYATIAVILVLFITALFLIVNCTKKSEDAENEEIEKLTEEFKALENGNSENVAIKSETKRETVETPQVSEETTETTEVHTDENNNTTKIVKTTKTKRVTKATATSEKATVEQPQESVAEESLPAETKKAGTKKTTTAKKTTSKKAETSSGSAKTSESEGTPKPARTRKVQSIADAVEEKPKTTKKKTTTKKSTK